MLTGDLVRVRIKEKAIEPRLVAVDNPRLLERGQSLVAIFEQAFADEWTRSQIASATKEIEGIDTDHKLTKGFTKVLMDRATFGVEEGVDPQALRDEVFRLAATQGPIARRGGTINRRTAEDVLATLGDPKVLGRNLYADLKDQQQILEWATLTPEQLLHRYNLALVQALLLKAETLTLNLFAPDPKHLRGLFRRLKFHQLMYRLEREGQVVRVVVDGPMSLLKRTTRYGLQLATFFPAVVLLPTPWRIQSTVRWGKRGLRKNLDVSMGHGLVSHYRATGTWRSQAEEWFEDRFRALDSGWSLEPGEPLDLGEQQIMVPDFTFRQGDRTAHLDIIGFWRKTWLRKRAKDTPDNMILAVSKKLCGADEALPKNVVGFAEVIPAKDVLAMVKKVAR